MDLALAGADALLPFILVGFAAQIVDGALGMAFGIICNTLLVAVMGMAPARASANIHIVETFTTAVSGISHLLHGNIDRRLFVRLLVPGLIGGVTGAWLLSNIDASVVKPFVLGYLVLVGVYLLARAATHRHRAARPKVVEPLGLVGGFLDAAGGGGWGPVASPVFKTVWASVVPAPVGSTPMRSRYGVVSCEQ